MHKSCFYDILNIILGKEHVMIGFDIGGTKCAVCVGAYSGDSFQITHQKKIPTDLSISPYEMIDRLCALAEEMTDDFQFIGVSCGGPLDSKQGIILSPPNLPGWDEVKISEYLNQKYGSIVRLENDANACALAEWRFGAGRGTQNMIFLTFGTGMGSGLILGGQLYSGACGNAGEIGHIRMDRFGPVGYGKAGSFEGFASGGGIAQMAKSAAMEQLQCGKHTAYCSSIDELNTVTAATVADAAKEGDPTALAVYRTCGEMLGRGLSVLVDLLNPEKIVLGSIYVRASELLKQSMYSVMERECLESSLRSVEIVPAELGEQLGNYAALALAYEATREIS